MSDKVQQPLRTFAVKVCARTIGGARAAAHASAEADYPGAEIRTGHPEEKRSGGKESERG